MFPGITVERRMPFLIAVKLTPNIHNAVQLACSIDDTPCLPAVSAPLTGVSNSTVSVLTSLVDQLGSSFLEKRASFEGSAITPTKHQPPHRQKSANLPAIV